MWVFYIEKKTTHNTLNKFDSFGLLFIPIFFIMFHLPEYILFSSAPTNIKEYLSNSFGEISSPLLILLYPLFRRVGTVRILNNMRVGFRIVAFTVIGLFLLNSLGVIDIRELNGFATKYRIGIFGADARLEHSWVSGSQKVVIIPFVGFAMILMLGQELSRSVTVSAVYFIALLIIGERGLIFGAVLITTLFLFLNKKSQTNVYKKYLLTFIMMVITVSIVDNIRFRLDEVFIKRSVQMFKAEDISTKVRIAHFQGYFSLVSESPYVLVFGAGPNGKIDNHMTGSRHSSTEMSVINTALHFGLPYLLLYLFILYSAIRQLWSKRYHSNYTNADLALIICISVFWIIGNTNPLMNSPFSIIAFMILRIRSSELT